MLLSFNKRSSGGQWQTEIWGIGSSVNTLSLYLIVYCVHSSGVADGIAVSVRQQLGL
jgi:hypothetical protein